jgi:hypothetical protein
MKALLKVYSYKWFRPNSYYDKEVGDGSIVYSLTGCIPEHVDVRNFEKKGLDLFRHMLNDDYFFNKKAYLTCYCDNDFRPKLPSQANQGFSIKQVSKKCSTNVPDASGFNAYESSPSKALSKLKDAAALAISVTTGKKLKI